MRYAMLVALLGLGCSVADLLEGKSCNAGADCGSGQTCVRTLTQARDNELGACSSTAECIVGEQLGCACDGACTDLACIEHLTETLANGAVLRFCCDSDCGENKEVVVGEVQDDQGFHAQCLCCTLCTDSEERDLDALEEGDCRCVPK
jgi:hypothetical protein